jgi:O-antigen/teichoic acid export membrane protein
MAVIALVWISAVLAAFTQVSRAVLRGLDLFASDAALNLILAVVMALALLLSVLLGPTAFLCAATILLARAAWFAAGRGFLRRRLGRAAARFAPGSGARLLAATTAYGAQIVIFRLLLEWNTIILHRFGGNAGVGEYQAVFRVVLATMLVSDILLQAFFPLLARLAASDRRELGRVAASLSRFLLASSAFIAGGLFIFAREVVAAGFGPAFAPAVPLLRILSLAVVAYSLSAAPTIVLIALGRQGTRARASGAVLAVHIAASFVLIPAWGGQGAAWGMVGAFTLYAVANSLVVRRSLSRFLFDRRAPRLALAAAVGIAIAWRLRTVSLLTGIAGYAALGILLFIAATSRSERGELRRAWPRFGPGPEIEP